MIVDDDDDVIDNDDGLVILLIATPIIDAVESVPYGSGPDPYGTDSTASMRSMTRRSSSGTMSCKFVQMGTCSIGTMRLQTMTDHEKHH